MRIRHFFALILLGIPLMINAQKNYYSKDKKAIKYYEDAYRAFNSRNYEDALDLLEKSLGKDPGFYEAWDLFSRVQFENGDMDEALQALYKMVDIAPKANPDNYFYMGQFEFELTDYKKAQEHLRYFLSLINTNNPRYSLTTRTLEDCDFAIWAVENPVPYSPKNLGKNVNTAAPEYLPTLTADDQLMLFTRRVIDANVPDGMQDDLFYSLKDNSGDWMPAKSLYGINSSYSEGAASISADGSTLVFTACDLFGKYGPGRWGKGSCDLFIANRTANGWSEPQNMGDSINSGNWESQPSLSADARTVYFIRAAKGQKKDRNQDIYVSTRLKNGEWSKAKKLPSIINTPFREETVQIHPDGVTLYFSSNGHPGMGGLDIFMTRKNENGDWLTPVNLGYPINTGNDENSLMVSTEGELAYFSSNMQGGFGSFDMYSFELYPEARPLPVTYFNGMVYDSLSRKPIGAQFELIDLDQNTVVFSAGSNSEDGSFLIPLTLGKDYALNVMHKGYLFYSDHFAYKNTLENSPFFLRVPLLPISKGSEVILKNVFFDTDAYDLKSESQAELNKLVLLLKNNPSLNITIEGYTDDQGSTEHNKKLSENRAESVYNYLINSGIKRNRLSFNGFGEQRPVADNNTEKGREKNRRTSFRVTAK